MSRQFKISVIVILSVTLLIILKDFDYKKKVFRSNKQDEISNANKSHFKDSFFNQEARFLDALDSQINVCYSNFNYSTLIEYESEDEVMMDFIKYSIQNHSDSLTNIKNKWKYTKDNTLTIEIYKNHPESISVKEKLMQMESDKPGYNEIHTFGFIAHKNKGYVNTTQWLKNVKYLAIAYKIKHKSPEILDNQTFSSGAYLYTIDLFELGKRRQLENKKSMAINSDSTFRNQFELILDLNKNNNKAIQKTLFRL
ncbi:MAG: hypothetical protein IT245_00445 [Bacteroidia bacterium]|nr:hypothetical protein [Bacteroidia bacterium]